MWAHSLEQPRLVTSFAFKSLLSRKLRTSLTAIAIVLGVAMISGTYVLTDSIANAFDAIFTQSYRGTDAVISGKSAFDLSSSGTTQAPPFDESLLAKVKALPDVRAAIGGVGGEAQLIGTNGKAIVFGGAPNLGFSVDPTQPQFNSLTLVDGRWPKSGEVVVDESTAGKKHIQIGQPIGVQADGPVERLRVSGLVKFGAVSTIGGATLAGFDLRTAQHLFDKTGKLDQIRVGAKSGVSPDRLTAEIRAILPPGTQVKSGNTQAASDAKDTNSFISFLQTFLLSFAGIALFVGAFVIANSLSITIAQRTREFATLRTLGASRRQVLRTVILEALVMGLFASVVGLVLGVALGRACSSCSTPSASRFRTTASPSSPAPSSSRWSSASSSPCSPAFGRRFVPPAFLRSRLSARERRCPKDASTATAAPALQPPRSSASRRSSTVSSATTSARRRSCSGWGWVHCSSSSESRSCRRISSCRSPASSAGLRR